MHYKPVIYTVKNWLLAVRVLSYLNIVLPRLVVSTAVFVFYSLLYFVFFILSVKVLKCYLFNFSTHHKSTF